MTRTTGEQDTAPTRSRHAKPPDPDITVTWTIAEAAARLGIGTSTAYHLIAQGTFPVRVVMIGQTRKVLKADLARYEADGIGATG